MEPFHLEEKNMLLLVDLMVETAEKVEMYILKLIKIKIRLLILGIIKNSKLKMVKMAVEQNVMVNMEKIFTLVYQLEQ